MSKGQHTAMLEEQPIITLIILPTSPGKAYLMLLVILLSQIHEYTPALEQPDRLSIVKGIGERWDAAIGIDLEEPGFFLLIGGDVDVFGFVRETKLFEGDGDLDAIGGGVAV